MTGAPDPLSLLGKTLAGHFLVETLAGEGRYSIVYRGQHIGPKKPVALKCLKLGANLDNVQAETFLRRFREDNKVNSQLTKQNPQFVRSIGSGMTTSGAGVHVPYTVFEWLDGRSLAADFAARRRERAMGRPLEELVSLLEPAVLAIAIAHDEKMAHGDVNAGNFFLVPRGGDAPAAFDVRVLDFGIAKVVGDLMRDLLPEAKDERIFSPAYGAPEHFDRGVGDFGPWTDCYGLALILVEAMRDRPAVEGDFARAALDAAKRPTPRALGMPVGEHVEAVFARALAKQPRERWQHARQMWKALKEALDADEASLTIRTAQPAPVHEVDAEVDAPARRGNANGGEDRAPVDGKTASSTGSGALPVAAAVVAAPAPPPSAPSIGGSPIAGAPVAVTQLPVSHAAGLAPSATPLAGGPLRSPVAGTAMKPLVKAASAPVGPVTPTAVRTQKLPTPAPSPSPIVASPAPPSAPQVAPQPKPGLGTGTTPRFGTSTGGAPRAIAAPTGRAVPLAGGPGAGVAVAASPGLAPHGGAPIAPPPPSSPTEVGRPIPSPRVVPVDRASPTPPLASPALGAPPLAAPLHAGHAPPAPPPPLAPPTPPGVGVAPIPNASAPAAARAEPLVGVPDMARTVREMLPPPKANIAVDDLPSVIVNDPESHKERLARSRETVRLPLPPPTAGWQAPTTPGRSGLSYEQRKTRNRRRLLIVALVSFLVVFAAGAGLLGLHYLSTQGQLTWPPR